MNLKSNFKDSLEYVYAVVSLVVLFYLMSMIEIFNDFDVQTFAYKILNDSFTGVAIGLLFFPVYFLFKLINNRLGIKFINLLFSIVLVIQLGLIGYSLTTHINLGADLLGYSLDDMYTTVTASLTISLATFLPFFVVLLLYFGLRKLLKKFGPKINTIIILAVFVLFAGLTFIFSAAEKPANQNKLQFLLSDIVRAKNDKAASSSANVTFKQEFPLQRSSEETPDVLSPFFNIKSQRPNIVFIIIEGLGSDFTDGGEYAGFTPFLDSLTTKSLYWKNFVSNAGRTFGALPSLMGSLPFGENGFMELNPIPKHNSLISILKSNGYSTSYYCGDESTFDRKSNFLEYNGIDKIIDINKFGPGYEMTKANSGGFSWGYPDAEIYRKTLSELKNSNQSRLDIIMTLTNHEPFDFPAKKAYLEKVERQLSSNPNKKKWSEYKDIFACLLYTDTSLKNFMKEYSKRADYANTIFIITGDHRLIPVPQKDNLSRFHVPFYIYSPLLKKTAIFKSISAHTNVTPSLISFLTNSYKLNKIEKTTWIADGLDTVRDFRNKHTIALMRYKGSINDYIYKEYFYSDGTVSKIDEKFNLEESGGSMKSTINSSFNDFKKLNSYVTTKDKITDTATNFNKPAYEFTKEELATIKNLTKGLDRDEIFLLARELAFNKHRANAKLLCNYILNDLPNYGDVRTLKGRILAWDGDYKNSEKELLEVINRTPFYGDSYLAIMDIYWWSGQDKKGIAIGKKGLANQIDNPILGLKLAEAYKRNNNSSGARKMIDSLLVLYPNEKEYLNFKKSLRK
ncbi:LTA synthase family protein [Flavobacterium antarcticum]|uniref:LTA synthase family protein n=1 Tax=Flavobacterium antarcticum TaxID=271155 RepID=UPI0003B5AA90|nr:LTA synthase family protein [Flavobacterium antarcticum]